MSENVDSSDFALHVFLIRNGGISLAGFYAVGNSPKLGKLKTMKFVRSVYTSSGAEGK